MKLISNPKIDVTNETILNINEKHYLVCGMMIEYMVFFIKKPDNQATIRFGNLYFNFNHYFFESISRPRVWSPDQSTHVAICFFVSPQTTAGRLLGILCSLFLNGFFLGAINFNFYSSIIFP
jgi:hypothetical protein